MTDNVIDMNEARITVTNLDIKQLLEPGPVNTAFNKLQGMTAPYGKTQYWIFKLLKQLLSIHDDIEKTRQTLMIPFVLKDENNQPKQENGRVVFINDEASLEFNRQFIEVLKEENKLNLKKIPVSSDMLEEMNKKTEDKLTLSDMWVLDKIIDFIE